MGNLLEKRWFRYLLQFCALIFIYLAYFFIRFLLPKKYRLTDYQLKKLGKHVNTITMNIVSPLDGIGEMLKKAMGIFEHFNSSWRDSSAEISFIEFLANQRSELKTYVSKIGISFLKPIIVDNIGIGKTVQEIDAGHSAVEYRFTSKKHKKDLVVVVLQSTGMDGSRAGSDYFSLSQRFATDATLTEIVDFYCEKLGDAIYITLDGDSIDIVVQHLSLNKIAMEHYICPEDRYNELTAEIKAFNANSRQRSYLLVGPPGTGKTSFCYETARRLGGRIMKIDNDVIAELGENVIQEMIEVLCAKIIIVDDIDRLNSGHNASQLLYAIESMKSLKTMPTLFATVNNVEELDYALLRPGRFDEILEFNVPEKNELYEFIYSYNMKSKVAMKPEHVDRMVEILLGCSQAYIVEYLEQLNYEKDIDKVIARIEKRKKYLKV